MKDAPEILQLPDQLANTIAAGEVIERPAAVVKELVENSLDAGATRITVRLEAGGQRLIEVVDDGHGIRADMLPRALGRHATSKLKQAEDLFAIGTLGFRGEALPSIAAVSEMEISSCVRGAEGRLLRVSGSQVEPLLPSAQPPGTRVSVRNLFWNVPARLKFLKGAPSETGHCSDLLIRLALAHPQVAFTLETDGRQALELLPNNSLAARIRACFGKALAERLLPVSGEHAVGTIAGFIGHPEQAKPSSKRQFVILNGRTIHDKVIVAALREGHSGFLEPRLHPIAFLHLDIDPSRIDVNVHPTKAEVRFRDSSAVFTLVRDAVRSALQGAAGGFSLLEQAPRSAMNPENPIVSRTVIHATPQHAAIQERFLPRETPVHAAPSLAQRVAESAPYNPVPSAPATPNAGDGLPPQVSQVVQLGDRFLLVETSQGIRLIDQHALHEKAILLGLNPHHAGVVGGGSQALLVPRTVELSASECAALSGLLPSLAEHGIEVEAFGPTTLLVRAHPPALAKLNWERFLGELAEGGDAGKAVAKLSEERLHRAACRAAVKAGQRLSPSEQRALVALLYRVEGLEHCPHGRPTTLDLSWDELNRRFQR